MKDEGLEMDIGLFNAAMGVCGSLRCSQPYPVVLSPGSGTAAGRISHGFGHLRFRPQLPASGSRITSGKKWVLKKRNMGQVEQLFKAVAQSVQSFFRPR